MNMAITITNGAGMTGFTVGLELDLYAGSPDTTTWQGTNYPGSITGSFDAVNADRPNVSGMKLLCAQAVVTDYKAAAITVQVSGEATSIQAFMLGSAGSADHTVTGLGGGVTGALSDTAGNGNNDTLTLTYPGGVSDVTTAQTQVWLICA